MKSFIKDNAFDGDKLSQTKRKPFAAQLVDEHCNNTNLRMSFLKLYKNIYDYNNPRYVTEALSEPAITESTSVTTNNDCDSELSYFSFGEQYRYTNNLKRHPLYIEPKFGSLIMKEEFADFFKRQLQITQQERIDDEFIKADPSIRLIDFERSCPRKYKS
eukprot:917360_1